MATLKDARLLASLTQAQLAAEVGLTQAAIAHYESGRRVPRLADCRKIAAALNRHGQLGSIEDFFPAPAELSTERREGDRRQGERRNGDRRQGDRRAEAA